MTEKSLNENEPHPIAFEAQRWVAEYLSDPKVLFMVKESLASSALADNRAAEIMLSTLERLLNSRSVSDRYLLGLAWFLRGIEGYVKGYHSGRDNGEDTGDRCFDLYDLNMCGYKLFKEDDEF